MIGCCKNSHTFAALIYLVILLTSGLKEMNTLISLDKCRLVITAQIGNGSCGFLWEESQEVSDEMRE